MNQLTTDPYLDQVAAALADLDASDREDLLEDLQLHLVELRAEEPDIDLVARLGSPQAYADELRQSAGLPAPDGRAPWTARVAAGRDLLCRRASRRPWVAAALAFLPQLRPAWWVLRAYGVVQLVDWWLHGGGYRWGVGVVPHVHGSALLGLLVLSALAVLSVRLATRPPSWRLWPRLALVANVVLAIATPGYFAELADDRSYPDYVQAPPCCGYLYGDDGAVYDNLYGYDGQGHLVPQLQLFDQNGHPVSVEVDDGAGFTRPSNVFPHPQYLPDGTFGVPTPPPFGGPVVVSPTTAPSPAAGPAATAKATPVG